MHSYNVIPNNIRDIQKLIFRHHLRLWDVLTSFILPLGECMNRLGKLPGAFGAFHGLADVGNILVVLRRIDRVHDEPRMAAVDLILTTEQRGGLVKHG